jgi:hypothetical protein
MSGTLDPADRVEIAELFARLARLLDDGRHEDIHTVYAPDVVVHSPRTDLHGIDEVLGFLRRSRVETEHTQHVNGGVLVTVDGARVEASVNQLVHYYHSPGDPPHRSSGLRLTYTVVPTPAGWRVREGWITLAWTTAPR